MRFLWCEFLEFRTTVGVRFRERRTVRQCQGWAQSGNANRPTAEISVVAPSIPPKLFETVGREFGVAGSVLYIAVAEVMLDRPRVLSVVGQLVAGGVA